MLPASELVLRNHTLRTQARQACHHATRLCSPSLVSGVTPDMDNEISIDELIRRNRALLSVAKGVVDRAREAKRTAGLCW